VPAIHTVDARERESGCERVSRAQQVPVRTQHGELLGGRDELAAANGPGQLGAVVGGLDLLAIGEQVFGVELLAAQWL
jgi:hypothetical protein